MKLVCFPHYTAGGLLCDILQGKFSVIGTNNGINSNEHSLGKIGDSDTVYTDFDADLLTRKCFPYQKLDIPVGTHCWPGNIDKSIYKEIILITTETTKSKVYRWLRAWHLYFSKIDEVKKLTGMDLIDKQRELAKNYLIPFRVVQGATNFEFADLVETTNEFLNVVNGLPVEPHLSRWKEINKFLYDDNLWNNELVQRYYEAEVEVSHGKFYKYY
jgi:hypothetical protein